MVSNRPLFWHRDAARHNNLNWLSQHNYTLYTLSPGETVVRVIADATISLSVLSEFGSYPEGLNEMLDLAFGDPAITAGLYAGPNVGTQAIPSPIEPGGSSDAAQGWLWLGQGQNPVIGDVASEKSYNGQIGTGVWTYVNPNRWSQRWHMETHGERAYDQGVLEHIFWSGQGYYPWPHAENGDTGDIFYPDLFLQWSVLVMGPAPA